MSVVEGETDQEYGLVPKRGRKTKFPGEKVRDHKRLSNSNEDCHNYKGILMKHKEYQTVEICCNKRCFEMISNQEQQSIFEQYYASASIENRTVYIVNCITEFPAKRKRPRNIEPKQRSVRVFKLANTKVCGKFFKNLLQISHGRINSALKRWKSSNLKDKRSSSKVNQMTPEKIQAMRDHISRFPKYISHYNRETTDALYLDSTLNLKLMYKLFKSNWTAAKPDNGSKQNKLPSIGSYRKVFERMNLKFKPLKSDTCKRCDIFRYKILAGEEVEKNKIARDTHQDKAKYLQQRMKNDFKLAASNISIQAFAFDLQKTYQLPRTSTGSLYYLRNLNMFNLGIHDGATDQGYFNVWLETDGGRGSQEIGTTLINFLETHILPETTSIILWSDSCGGQNRNHKLCILLHHFLASHRTLQTITLRFLQSGHSFMSCDRDFGIVEKAVKKKQSIWTPNEYVAIMRNCRERKKFEVRQVDRLEFMSVEPLLKNITKRENDFRTKEKISWLNTHEIALERENPFLLKMKYDVSCDEVGIFNLSSLL